MACGTGSRETGGGSEAERAIMEPDWRVVANCSGGCQHGLSSHRFSASSSPLHPPPPSSTTPSLLHSRPSFHPYLAVIKNPTPLAHLQISTVQAAGSRQAVTGDTGRPRQEEGGGGGGGGQTQARQAKATSSGPGPVFDWGKP